jgi:hypothetical protein
MSVTLVGEMIARVSDGLQPEKSKFEGCFMAPGLKPVIWLSERSVVM